MVIYSYIFLSISVIYTSIIICILTSKISIFSNCTSLRGLDLYIFDYLLNCYVVIEAHIQYSTGIYLI